MLKRYSEKEEAFWRKVILPEEDHLSSGGEWDGGYRWFRSENVICLEHYQAIKTKPAPQSKAS
jgi:hypothetical protein